VQQHSKLMATIRKQIERFFSNFKKSGKDSIDRNEKRLFLIRASLAIAVTNLLTYHLASNSNSRSNESPTIKSNEMLLQVQMMVPEVTGREVTLSDEKGEISIKATLSRCKENGDLEGNRKKECLFEVSPDQLVILARTSQSGTIFALPPANYKKVSAIQVTKGENHEIDF